MIVRGVVPELVLAVALLLSPFVFIHLGASYDLMERVLDWGILGIGLDLLFGWTGLLSFGQAAFFGTGGFVAAYLLVNNLLSSVWIALAIGTIAAAVAGLLVGWLAVRRIGIYFAMITLAFGQMAFFLENNPLSAFTGGENGLSGVPEPTLGFGEWAQRIHPGRPMYWLLAAFFFASFRACPTHRPLAVRCGAACDQGEHGPRGHARSCRAALQACGVRHRRGICGTGRRTAGRAAELHAARCIHARHLRPTGCADGDRWRRNTDRAGGRRGSVAVAAR